MKEMTQEDLPLYIDAAFAMAMHAYVLTLKDHVENDFSIEDCFCDRFKQQGFDESQSRRVAKDLDRIFQKLLIDAKEELK